MSEDIKDSGDTTDDIDQPGQYQNSMDTESHVTAKMFLICMAGVIQYHGFMSIEDALKDYRRFANEQKRLHLLPERIKQMRTARLGFPGMQLGTWGQYAYEWIQNLKQAECDDQLLADTMYELQQYGFLPKDLTA